MKKDINFPEITDVKIAVGKSINEKGESSWYVYVINNKPTNISNVMVVSNARENEDGSGRKTSTLRHFMQEVAANSFEKVEAIDPAVFGFYNEFWLSFYTGKELFDKKMMIKPFSEWELEEIEELEMQGKATD